MVVSFVLSLVAVFVLGLIAMQILIRVRVL